MYIVHVLATGGHYRQKSSSFVIAITCTCTGLSAVLMEPELIPTLFCVIGVCLFSMTQMLSKYNLSKDINIDGLNESIMRQVVPCGTN